MPLVSPPSDAPQAAALGTPPHRPAGSGTPSDPQSNRSVVLAADAVDRADIRPLDLTAALQILVAEVRAELTLVLLQAIDTPISAKPDAIADARFGPNPSPDASPNRDAVLPAARDLLESVLNSLPENSQEAAVWTGALARVDAAVELGMTRALDIINNWRDVPEPVVSGAQELRTWVAHALSDEALNPIWLRPEWLNLAPRLLRLRRRRKFLQRRLTDPDHSPSFFEDPEPLT